MSEAQTTQRVADRSGRSVVLFLYVAVVAIAGGWGYVLGSLGIEDLSSVRLFFLFELQPTPVGLAVYGAVTMAALLGVLLLGVRYASQQYSA